MFFEFLPLFVAFMLWIATVISLVLSGIFLFTSGGDDDTKIKSGVWFALSIIAGAILLLA